MTSTRLMDQNPSLISPPYWVIGTTLFIGTVFWFAKDVVQVNAPGDGIVWDGLGRVLQWVGLSFAACAGEMISRCIVAEREGEAKKAKVIRTTIHFGAFCVLLVLLYFASHYGLAHDWWLL